MQRRDALKLLFTGAVLPVLPPEAFALLQQAHPAAGYTIRTLSPHQNATVITMTDLIIPETTTPGARGAKVNEFIDLILGEWATEEERTNFLDGLAGVDKQSNELFGKDFVDASAAQQTALLRALDDAALAERAPARATGNFLLNPAQARDTQLQGNFWTVFKGITLHGYYTSEIGFSQELKLQIIPGAYHGCTPVPSEPGKA
jgi:Gluconate 2-dehydrogenase subunit 3